jgi:cytochrome c
MSRSIDRFAGCIGASVLLTGVTFGAMAGNYPGVGRIATPAEIAAWDIDVRPDFKGLPAGSGSVARGQQIWDSKCMSCHGTFGESNEVFAPLVGGTTAADIRRGRAASLMSGDVPRTMFMKLSSVSTLWDYVNRAMPWNAPKSLSADEVYAVVAYLLNLADIVADSFVLSDRNMAEIQQKLPNRDGITRDHGLWDVSGKPDVENVACMTNCPIEAQVASAIPEHARGSHGDLAQQNRAVGTARSEKVAQAPQPGAMSPAEVAPPAPTPADLARRRGCLACHAIDARVLGPAFREVAARYAGQAGMEARLVEILQKGSSGSWGSIPMPANPDLPASDARALARWILAGAAVP